MFPQQPQSFGQQAPQYAQQSQSIFRGIGQARPVADSNYVRPGEYICLLNRAKGGMSRKRVYFVANEMTIIYVIDNAAGLGHRVGEDVTHMMMSDKDQFLGEVQAFLHVLNPSIPAEQITEQMAEMAYGPQNPLAGTIVQVKATQITLKNGQPFTRVRYQKEISYREIAANLPPDLVERFFPNGILQQRMAMEAQMEAQAGAQPQPGYPPQQPPQNPNVAAAAAPQPQYPQQPAQPQGFYAPQPPAQPQQVPVQQQAPVQNAWPRR